MCFEFVVLDLGFVCDLLFVVCNLFFYFIKKSAGQTDKWFIKLINSSVAK